MIREKSKKFDPKKLKKLRESQKLTWLGLTKELRKYEPKVSKHSIWGWERGDNSPSLKYLNALSAFFQVPTDEFMKE